jgi:pyruvate kinase
MNSLDKKTKILATLGPASESAAIIGKLIDAGANAFRLNFSHGTQAEHATRIATIRSVAAQRKVTVAILADLQGPKLRTGNTPDDKAVTLIEGSVVRLTARNVSCNATTISISYPRLTRDTAVGQIILLNDGAVRLEVQSIDKLTDEVVCRVLNTGAYASHKGVNFPSSELSIPALTVKDRRDLQFILSQDVNYIALSFVRHPRDLYTLQSLVRRAGKAMKIIAKIEKPQAREHLVEILDACDGIMVARGDLGVEMPLAEVPVLQKDFVAQANRRGKLVIVATQMLESMIQSPSPTRAETTDVANAIIDGADTLMLSAETAAGAYPVEAVQTMTAITRATEQSTWFHRDFIDLQLAECYPPHAICEAAERASRDLGGAPIIVFTTSGDTALYLAKIRNQSPIYAFTPSVEVADMLALAWNVRPFVIGQEESVVVLVGKAEKALVRRKIVSVGEVVVVISGTTSMRGATNFLRIKRIGEV